jgi:hypothetical protein
VAQKCRHDSRTSMLHEIGARPLFLEEVVHISATLHRWEVNCSVRATQRTTPSPPGTHSLPRPKERFAVTTRSVTQLSDDGWW